jgi:hypothetical protein
MVDMMVQLNTLTLAVHALQGCHELDSSDLGSKARNVLCLCDHELHELMNQLEEWEIQNRPAAETAHG